MPTIEIPRFKLDLAGYKIALEVEIREVLEAAAVKFVKHIAFRIPSLTGQARASVLAIAQDLGLHTGISPQRVPHSPYRHRKASLEAKGNTAARGFSLGRGAISVSASGGELIFENSLTAAHSGKAYYSKQINDLFEEAFKIAALSLEIDFQVPNIARYINA